ncbi:MAG: LysR family transcriptional regulator [Gemmobacter sp.]
MSRTLDLSALRSLVAVVDAGGVTRAAGLLNLTQSAVSMQIRRLEDALGLALFVREGRRMSPTPEGEQLVAYARRMLAMNDEVLGRLTGADFDGELRVGVPCDILQPAVPALLRRLALCCPRLRVTLTSSFTIPLKAAFARGELDLTLTTEDRPGDEGELLVRRELVWVGAPDGVAPRSRPLRLGFTDECIFRGIAQRALDRAGIDWLMASDGRSEQAIEAAVAADLAVTVRMEGVMPQGLAPVAASDLPPPGDVGICLYIAPTVGADLRSLLTEEVRRAYADPIRLVA